VIPELVPGNLSLISWSSSAGVVQHQDPAIHVAVRPVHTQGQGHDQQDQVGTEAENIEKEEIGTDVIGASPVCEARSEFD
jgi:hypothetical protein